MNAPIPDQDIYPPGKLSVPAQAEVLGRFLPQYRLNLKPTSVPTACILDGAEIEPEFIGRSPKIRTYSHLFVLFEHPRRLGLVDVPRILELLDTEQWEDVDICIFPEDMGWCIGYTHNATCLLVDKFGVFGARTGDLINPTLLYYR
jgi:hypothetical protein